MRRHALLGALPPLFILLQVAECMKFDPERIAARLRIDEKWDQLEAFQSVKSRRGRQIQPKEISIQVGSLYNSKARPTLYRLLLTNGNELYPCGQVVCTDAFALINYRFK